MGKPVDNPGTPTLCSLLCEDIPANRPIEENQLAIDRERSPNLCRTNAVLELLEEVRVAGGELERVTEGKLRYDPISWPCPADEFSVVS